MLAYEGFALPSGVLLDKYYDFNSAFQRAWRDPAIGSSVKAGNGLSYPNLVTSGSSLSANRVSTVGRQFSFQPGTPFTDYYKADFISPRNRTLWLSALLRKSDTTKNAVFVSLGRGIGNNVPSVYDSAISIGYFDDYNNQKFWTIRTNERNNLFDHDIINTTAKFTNSTIPLTPMKTMLLVARLEQATDGSCTVALFVNPTQLGGAAPLIPDAITTTTSGLPFSALAIQAGTTGQDAVDEVRIGESYAAVTPIQTPVPLPIPAPPTQVAVSLNANEEPVITWTAPTGAQSYKVGRLRQGTTVWEDLASGITGTSYTDTSALPGHRYSYWIKAVNSSGTSNSSVWVAITVSPAVVAPGRVTGVTLTLNDQGKPKVTWAVTPGATSYRVNRNLLGTTTYEVLAPNWTATTYTDVTALPGRRYAYWINAINTGGVGRGSAWVAITTPPAGNG